LKTEFTGKTELGKNNEMATMPRMNTGFWCLTQSLGIFRMAAKSFGFGFKMKK